MYSKVFVLAALLAVVKAGGIAAPIGYAAGYAHGISPFPYSAAPVAYSAGHLGATLAYSAPYARTLAAPALGYSAPIPPQISSPVSSYSTTTVTKSLPATTYAAPAPIVHSAYSGQIASPLSYSEGHIASPLSYSAGHIAAPLHSSYASPLAYSAGHIPAPLAYSAGHIATPLGYSAGHIAASSYAAPAIGYGHNYVL